MQKVRRARRRAVVPGRSFQCQCEVLERRVMLCAMPHDFPHVQPVELRPDLVGVPAAGSKARAQAVINWVNRGQSSDGFATVFGSNASTARNIVDQVIIDYMKMIQSFNYSDGGNVYDLTVRMGDENTTGGFAWIDSMLGGKPKSGTIHYHRGNNGSGGGFYLDPRPQDHAEFSGALQNAFSSNAPAGSAPAGLRDFYSLIAHEIGHALGVYGNPFFGSSLWNGRTTNTEIADNDLGGGVGTFWTFEGPSIKHLMTSNNGGADGNDDGGATHSAGPNSNINFGGTNWRGASDMMNSVGAAGRRTLIPDVVALMFKDAYNYTVAPANTRDSFHSILNRNTGELLIRGGSRAGSSDTISVTMSGSNIHVSVNVGLDVPGTGALPGTGNLPAYTSSYFQLDVTSIRIEGFDGNDNILLDAIPVNIPVTINGGDGDDLVRIGDASNTLNGIGSNVTIDGGAGVNTVLLDDSANDLVDDTYVFDSDGDIYFDRGAFPLVVMSNVQMIELLCSSGFETVNVSRLSGIASLLVRAGGGNDVLNLAWGTNDLLGVQGSIVFLGEGGTDTINVLDSSNASNSIYYYFATGDNRTLDREGVFGTITVDNTVEAINISTGSGGSMFQVRDLDGTTDLTINAGAGNDTLLLGAVLNGIGGVQNDIAGIQGDVIFNGQGGTDSVIISDTLPLQGLTYTVTGTTFDRSIFGSLTFQTVENITINSTRGACTFNINPSGAGLSANLTVNAQSADDTFRVTPTSASMNLILADLTFNGGGGSDSMQLFDGNSSVNFPYIFSSTSLVRGSTAVNYSGVESISLSGASGNNLISVLSVGASTAVTLGGGAGNDTFIIGAAGQNLDVIAGDLTLDGGAGSDSLELRDQQNPSFTQYLVTSTGFDRTNFPMLTYAALESITVNGGSGDGVFYVYGLPSTTSVNLFGHDGADQFIFGLADQVASINGPVTVNGGAGIDALTVNDQESHAAGGFTISSSSITRPAAFNVSYAAVETIQVNAGNFPGTPNRTHVVESTADGTSVLLNAGNGNDTILITPTLQVFEFIAGNLTVSGQGGNDTLIIHDQGNDADDVYDIGSTTIKSEASAILTYLAIESITLNSGSGGSDINLNGATAPLGMTVNAGPGDDAISIAALSNFPALVLNGQGGEDTIFINDSVSGTDSYTLTATTLARTGFNGLTYTDVEAFHLRAQTGNNQITVNGTAGPVYLDANNGNDAITVNSTASQGDVWLIPSGGLDRVSLNTDDTGTAGMVLEGSISLASLIIGVGGFFSVTQNGGRVLRTTSLTVNGSLDLSDNALIVDYTNTNPLNSVRNALTSGYNGGAWNGTGISSSTAAAIPGRALGFAEATDLFGIFPATFAGQSIDNTSVLVRFTINGDANLDRKVDVADLGILASNWQQTGRIFSQGDFNYDGVVDVADLGILASNWQKELAASAPPVKSPRNAPVRVATLVL